MSEYILKFTKGDITFEFMTSDYELISKHASIWVKEVYNSSGSVKSKKIQTESEAETPKTSKPVEQKEKPVKPETTEAKEETVAVKEETVSSSPVKEKDSKDNFLDVLQGKISSIPEKVSQKLEGADSSVCAPEDIEKLLKTKKPESMVDYLLLASYYLRECESVGKYSLKQINSKVMSIAKKPVDHSIVQTAVDSNYIEIVPDITGDADVTEYKITPEGESYLLNAIK